MFEPSPEPTDHVLCSAIVDDDEAIGEVAPEPTDHVLIPLRPSSSAKRRRLQLGSPSVGGAPAHGSLERPTGGTCSGPA
eukprot:13406182-Heterocapsa_arctica.AAC.1